MIGHGETRNLLLCNLQRAVRDRVAPHLERVSIRQSRVLHHANTPIEHVYFIESGLISVMANVGDGQFMEVWLLGHEGVAGVPAMFGELSSAHKRVVHLGGSALRMSTRDLQRLMDDLPPFREAMLKYAYVVLFQTSQAGACNAKHSVEQRLARWLLMARDRCGGGRLQLTQQVLARMLGVRRATVTQCIDGLEKSGLLEKSRGSIKILDCEELAVRTCHCYRAIQSKYERLFRTGQTNQEANAVLTPHARLVGLDGIACRAIDP
jgi:CRP-like cAMP-binding protein